MGGVCGLIGAGSLDEVEKMAARMAYRGPARIWNPAPRVMLAELGEHAGTSTRLALDASGWLRDDPDLTATLPHERRSIERERLEADLERDVPETLRALRGLFALVWVDEQHGIVTLAADRQNYKSLYLAHLDGRIAFATDYKALLALEDCPANVNRDVLQTYLLCRSFHSSRSLLQAAEPVGRGALISVRTRDLATTRGAFWQPLSQGSATRTGFGEAAATFRDLMEQALRNQLQGHERVGLALSGGLDSAAVLALAKHVRPDLQIASYTIGHGPQDADILRAREVAGHFGTLHNECFLSVGQIPEELDRLVWLTEDLTGREEAVLQQVVTAVAGRQERLLLAGHGADAALAGMPRHRLLWLRDRTFPPLSNALHELYVYTQARLPPRSWLGRRLVDRVYGADQPEMPHLSGLDAPSAIGLTRMSLDEYRAASVNSLDGLRFHEPIDAAHRITMISPFLDAQVMQFAVRCPTAFLINARWQKRILRAALRGLVPAAIAGKPKTIQRLKHDVQLSEVLTTFAEELRLADALPSRGVLSRRYIRRAIERPAGTALSSERLHILWALISAELWFRHFVDLRGAERTLTAPVDHLTVREASPAVHATQ